MPIKIIIIIKALYQHTDYNVKINTELSEWFSHTITVKVEYILPLLPRSISFNFLRVSTVGRISLI